jgi:DNA-binding beta-propeller fold protein YncE
LKHPRFACFVHRNGVDTLLICDLGNDRVVEVTATGVFLRAIAVEAGSWPSGVAYCSIGDVVAVSLKGAHAVVLLQYESGAVKPEVTIGLGTGTWGCGDGQLWNPIGVAFTADSRYILVADCSNHRVSKFSAATGAFIAHLATQANGICFPRDVLECEDGSIVVAHGGYASPSVVCVRQDGGFVQNLIIPSAAGDSSRSLSYSVMLKGVVVKTFGGAVFLVRDAWMCSSRSAWLSALSCS